MNTETKKHIDAARQVLVGVVPNPTSQIDQITNALIYKFMDDMDQSAIKAGGNPSFFVGDLERYAWTRLMDARMGNQERMNLYSEALLKFSQAKQLPELFRSIFKSAFLPYRSPETLGLFLKEISYFDYSHPEELGNAYEYLLSIMSSQGDAGQFRTPRHIIDFIVDVVNPTKDDKVLDPACGTGGFLVSSYKHILEQHDGINDPDKKEKPLTPDQRRNLMNNFEGYDIDPTMVRIAQVNMYLHQFKNPKIFQYDTLSSDERWNDKFDVILANPPFMTPKGGIKPHQRFSFKSRRSEALFVDYLIEHLTINGKAGIIVPDGIVNNKSFFKLRQSLVENGLYAVVSLHQYVFKPYAGAKTSILFFDKSLKENSGNVLFAEMDNDGFQKGAQRLKINEDDIPSLTKMLIAFKKSNKSLSLEIDKYKISSTVVNLNSLDKNVYFHYVDQLSLFPNTYIYKNNVAINPQKAIRIADIFKIKKGILQSTKATSGQYRFITASDEYLTHDEYTNDGEAIVIAVAAGGSLGKVQYVNDKFVASDLCFVMTPKRKSQTDMLFYLYYFKNIRTRLVKILAKGVSKQSINKTDFSNLLIDNFNVAAQKKLGDNIKLTREKIFELEDNIIKLENKLVDAVEIVRKDNAS